VISFDPPTGTQVLLDNPALRSRVTYDPAFLPAAEATAWMARLALALPLGPEAPVMFGKPILVRRTSCGIGDPGRRYRYSGIERAAAPWPDEVGPLLDRLYQRTGARFTFALCNFYPDGDVGLGWHADDEGDLARDAPIASLSLGAPRDFAMRPGRAGRACLTVALAPGSLLVMEGQTQRHYQHRVPPRVRCAEARLNLTFRVMR
jgi:alkylated DNA repair dioxygenase AlkB